MNDLVVIKNGVVVTTQNAVSSITENSLESIQRLIRNYKDDLEEFGELCFEIENVKNAKNKINTKKLYYLNEQQATLLLTYMKNTPQVREAKKILVKEFYRLKQTQAYDPKLIENLTSNIDKLLSENDKLKAKITQIENKTKTISSKAQKPYRDMYKRIQEQEEFIKQFGQFATQYADDMEEHIKKAGNDFLCKAMKLKVDYNEKKTKIYKIL